MAKSREPLMPFPIQANIVPLGLPDEQLIALLAGQMIAATASRCGNLAHVAHQVDDAISSAVEILEKSRLAACRLVPVKEES